MNGFNNRNFSKLSSCFLSLSFLAFMCQDTPYCLKIRNRGASSVTQCEQVLPSKVQESKKPIFIVLNNPGKIDDNVEEKSENTKKIKYDYSSLLNVLSANLRTYILSIPKLEKGWNGLDIEINKESKCIDLKSLLKSDKVLSTDKDWNLFFENINQALREFFGVPVNEDFEVERVRSLVRNIGNYSRFVVLIPFQCSNTLSDVKMKIIESSFGPVILCREDFLMKCNADQLKKLLQKTFNNEGLLDSTKLLGQFCSFEVKKKVVNSASVGELKSEIKDAEIAEKRRDDDSSSYLGEKKENGKSNLEGSANKENQNSAADSRGNIGSVLASSIVAGAAASDVSSDLKVQNDESVNSDDDSWNKIKLGLSLPFVFLNGLVTAEKGIRGVSDDRESKIANWVPRLGQTSGEQGKSFRDLWLGGNCSLGSGTREIAQILAPAALAYHAYQKLTDKLPSSN